MSATSRAEKKYLRRLDKELNKQIQCDPVLSRAAARMSGTPKQGRIEAFLTYCDNSRYPFLWYGTGAVLGVGTALLIYAYAAGILHM